MTDRNINETVDYFVEIMDRRGIGISFLVDRTGLDRTTIKNCIDKKWKTSPLYGTVEAIAKALGVNLSRVLKREESRTVTLSDEEYSRYEKYSLLSEEDKIVLDSMLERLYIHEKNSIKDQKQK